MGHATNSSNKSDTCDDCHTTNSITECGIHGAGSATNASSRAEDICGACSHVSSKHNVENFSICDCLRVTCGTCHNLCLPCPCDGENKLGARRNE